MLEHTKIFNTGMLGVGYSIRSGVNADLLLRAEAAMRNVM